MLPDAETFLSVDRYRIPLPFQPYNNTWAVRDEAISFLKILIENECRSGVGSGRIGGDRRPLREEMVRQLLRHRVVEKERERLWNSKAPRLHHTVISVLR